jgi:hypothetical protein
LGRETAITDVRETVAVRVGPIGMGVPRKIGSEAIGRRQARTFAYKHEAEAGSESKPNRISNGHPALLHQTNRGNRPSSANELRQKLCKEWNGMTLNCQSREAIRDGDDKIAGA